MLNQATDTILSKSNEINDLYSKLKVILNKTNQKSGSYYYF